MTALRSSLSLRTTPAEQGELDAAYAALAVRERLLPIKVPAFYQRKLDEEAADRKSVV